MFELVRRHWKLLGIGVLGGLILFYGGTLALIEWQLRRAVAAAQSDAEQDPVDALMAVVQSSTTSLDEKEHAIWALGRLADPRALAVLDPLFTGAECDHAHALCQYKLERAVQRCQATALAVAD